MINKEANTIISEFLAQWKQKARLYYNALKQEHDRRQKIKNEVNIENLKKINNIYYMEY